MTANGALTMIQFHCCTALPPGTDPDVKHCHLSAGACDLSAPEINKIRFVCVW